MQGAAPHGGVGLKLTEEFRVPASSTPIETPFPAASCPSSFLICGYGTHGEMFRCSLFIYARSGSKTQNVAPAQPEIPRAPHCTAGSQRRRRRQRPGRKPRGGSRSETLGPNGKERLGPMRELRRSPEMLWTGPTDSPTTLTLPQKQERKYTTDPNNYLVLCRAADRVFLSWLLRPPPTHRRGLSHLRARCCPRPASTSSGAEGAGRPLSAPQGHPAAHPPDSRRLHSGSQR